MYYNGKPVKTQVALAVGLVGLFAAIGLVFTGFKLGEMGANTFLDAAEQGDL